MVTNTVLTHRKEKNMTQEDLGQVCCVSRQTIIAIEKGNYTPSVSLALQLAIALDTSVEKLFKYEK